MIMASARLAFAFTLCIAALPLRAQAQGTGGDGQLLFNNACRTCHTVKDGDNRLGPNLHAIIGRKSAALKDYAYSDSLAKADLVWDKATLDRFIANPEAVVRGNKMQPYGGMPSAEERAEIIAYLERN
jgi:cytochrome c